MAGGLILWFLGGWSLWLDYDVATENDYTMWTVPGIHWQIGGVFVIVFISWLLGLIAFIALRIAQPDFFKGRDADPGHAHAGARRVRAAGRDCH